MITNKRKLPAMHEVYGKRPPHKCRECCNMTSIKVRNEYHYKCIAYGNTYSEATDWGLNFVACGLFNIPFYEQPLLEQILGEAQHV